MVCGIIRIILSSPIQGTIHYIFQCDTDSALKDAKQVTDTFQTDENAVYFFRIKSWIMKDKVILLIYLLTEFTRLFTDRQITVDI